MRALMDYPPVSMGSRILNDGAAGLAVDFDTPVVARDDVGGHCETEPHAAGLCSRERFEQAIGDIGMKTRPIIDELDLQAARARRRSRRT
jgi:hypothetical protein